MIQSGQVCESCGEGTYCVYSSFLNESGTSQVQYVRCSQCFYRPANNKIVKPAENIRRREFTLVRKRLDLKRPSRR